MEKILNTIILKELEGKKNLNMKICTWKHLNMSHINHNSQLKETNMVGLFAKCNDWIYDLRHYCF